MINDASAIASHYAYNHLYDAILHALERNRITPDKVTRKDLAAIDEFHVRGQEVTRELAIAAVLQPGMRVLDAGCGLGGPCRLLADAYGCDVTGIDISSDYIQAAQQLSALTGLQQHTHFVEGNVLAMPFADNSFDLVLSQHVQMNIADKKTFYTEVQRVLITGGRFIYYDVLVYDPTPVQYPVPWASDASLSFLITSQQLQTLLQETGFEPLQVTSETDKGIAFLQKLLQRVAQKGWPALGLHLLMGSTAMKKLNNLRDNLVTGSLVLESGVYRKG